MPAGRTASAQDLGDLGRPAEGRPLRFLRAGDARPAPLDPVDADHSAAWKGTAVHEVLEQWLAEDECDPDRLLPRAEALLAAETIHPMLRALWQPRLMEAIRWVEAQEIANRAEGRRPLAAEKRGEAEIGGVAAARQGRPHRPAGQTAAWRSSTTRPARRRRRRRCDAGFALQLGLLGLIAEAGGFEGVAGAPEAHEYWSLTKYRDQFGTQDLPGQGHGAGGVPRACARPFPGGGGEMADRRRSRSPPSSIRPTRPGATTTS